MTEVVQERVDPVREFVDRARRAYDGLVRELLELAELIYKHCPYQGRLSMLKVDGRVKIIWLDGRFVSEKNILDAVALARQLAAIARERRLVNELLHAAEQEYKELQKAITIAESIGMETPPEARDKERKLQERIAQLKQRLRQLDEECRQLQNPFDDDTDNNSDNTGTYRDCIGPACPH